MIESYDTENYTVNTTIIPFKIDINVPFAEKEEAKKAGMYWDTVKKTWFAPPGKDIAVFAKWMHDANIYSRQYFIAKTLKKCWSCKKEVPVFAIMILFGLVFSEDYMDFDIHVGPSWLSDIDFLPEEIVKIINNHGGIYKISYSNMTKARYYMNHCQYCGSKQGDWLLFQEPDEAFLIAYAEDRSELVYIGHDLYAGARLLSYDPASCSELSFLKKHDRHSG